MDNDYRIRPARERATGELFADVDVVWKYYNYAVYGGTKR